MSDVAAFSFNFPVYLCLCLCLVSHVSGDDAFAYCRMVYVGMV